LHPPAKSLGRITSVMGRVKTTQRITGTKGQPKFFQTKWAGRNHKHRWV
jgi:hypothetical protein